MKSNWDQMHTHCYHSSSQSWPLKSLESNWASSIDNLDPWECNIGSNPTGEFERGVGSVINRNEAAILKGKTVQRGKSCEGDNK